MTLTVFNSIFFLAFLLSAAVQYNDPDAGIWIASYCVAAYMCFTQLRRKRPRWMPLILLVVSLLWIALLLPEIIGQVNWNELFDSLSMRTQAVEEAREIGGLVLIALWSAVLFIHNRRKD